MTIDEIKKLIELVQHTGISELEVKFGEDSVRIRGPVERTQQEITLPAIYPVPMAGAASQPLPALTPPPASPASTEPARKTEPLPEEENTLLVKSPIVGTYYDAPAPGAPPFVAVGARVEPKQVLCIIESMKLMNEIEAEIAGTIVVKHVENGRPIEYGEALFTVRPA